MRKTDEMEEEGPRWFQEKVQANANENANLGSVEMCTLYPWRKTRIKPGFSSSC
jgi:hypothetical protein